MQWIASKNSSKAKLCAISWLPSGQGICLKACGELHADNNEEKVHRALSTIGRYTLGSMSATSSLH